MSGDPEQEYFADGMVEDIITALSRIRWLFVIARNSSFTYKGRARRREAGRARAGRALCARRHVRKGGDRVRITAQLIDADDRHASLGRPLRRLTGRRLRAAGQGRDQRRRRHRAGIAGGRDHAAPLNADHRPHRLRPLPARAAALLQHDARRLCRRAPAHQRGAQHRPWLQLGEGTRRLYPQPIREPVLARAR